MLPFNRQPFSKVAFLQHRQSQITNESNKIFFTMIEHILFTKNIYVCGLWMLVTHKKCYHFCFGTLGSSSYKVFNISHVNCCSLYILLTLLPTNTTALYRTLISSCCFRPKGCSKSTCIQSLTPSLNLWYIDRNFRFWTVYVNFEHPCPALNSVDLCKQEKFIPKNRQSFH